MTTTVEQSTPRILIVEDDDAQRKILCDIMRDEGVVPVSCANATDAIEFVEREDVAVAIVDLRLPDLNGTEVLERMRALNDGIRVIIYTAYGSFESAKDAVNLGAFAYVEKLTDPGELVNHVHRAVEERLARDDRPRSITRNAPGYIFQLDWKGTIVPGMERLLQRLIGEHIRLETIQPRGIDPIYADMGQIEQVIMNLVLNARDAMPEGGKLAIETANVTLDDDYVAENPEAKPGPHVMIAVGDSGHGMSQETLDCVFDPFFTTQAPGKASGLGLTEVYGIVAQAGGHIVVESEPEVGSTFRVYFPAVR